VVNSTTNDFNTFGTPLECCVADTETCKCIPLWSASSLDPIGGSGCCDELVFLGVNGTELGPANFLLVFDDPLETNLARCLAGL
jgi:hypothetical protein